MVEFVQGFGPNLYNNLPCPGAPLLSSSLLRQLRPAAVAEAAAAAAVAMTEPAAHARHLQSTATTVVATIRTFSTNLASTQAALGSLTAAVVTGSVSSSWLEVGNFPAGTTVSATAVTSACVSACGGGGGGGGGGSSTPATNVGAIVGGVIGGLAFLGLLAGLFVYLRKRRIARNSVSGSRAAHVAGSSSPGGGASKRVRVLSAPPAGGGGTGSFRRSKKDVAALFEENPLQTDSTREIIKAARASNAPTRRRVGE